MFSSSIAAAKLIPVLNPEGVSAVSVTSGQGPGLFSQTSSVASGIPGWEA